MGLIMEEIFLRKVSSADIHEVFAHSNEAYVREHSIRKEKITWEEHVRWFDHMLGDKMHVFYVITDHSDRFLGQIRYQIEGDQAVVSISLSKLIMGKGLSRNLLQESMKKLYEDRKEVKTIVAYVSENNIASNHLFQKSRYTFVDKKKELLKYIYTERGKEV